MLRWKTDLQEKVSEQVDLHMDSAILSIRLDRIYLSNAFLWKFIPDRPDVVYVANDGPSSE